MQSKYKRELVKKDYNEIADDYYKVCSQVTPYENILQLFTGSLIGNKILDFGCGPGTFTGYFHSKGFKVIGVDFSNKMLKIAKNLFPDIRFVKKDIINYKSKEKFDGIFVKNVLFHIPKEDIDSVFENIKAMLKDDGKLCIIMEIPRFAGEQILPEEFNNTIKLYYNYLSVKDVECLLEKHKFNIEYHNEKYYENKSEQEEIGKMIFLCSK